MKHILFCFAFAIIGLHSNGQTVGLITKDPASLDGYVLFSPITAKTTYLMDKCGYQVHTWTSQYQCGLSAYLNPDGTLLRPGILDHNPVFQVPGHGGIIEKYDWDGNLIWSYTLSSDTDMQHHDVVPLPNGNVLALSWELKTPAQAIAIGRNPAYLVNDSLWCEKIVEIQPIGATGGNIVWEWHICDHLIQDYDSIKANYGIVSQHPELLNLNYIGTTIAGQIAASDWLHCNSLAYNPKLDQILLNSRNLSEMWFIDHSTTTAQAASHSGGANGKGGDFLYRWGNPAVYNAATPANEILYGEHSPNWIDSGLIGAGNILLFNNGWSRPAGNYSSVEIFATPVDSAGNYPLVTNHACQPDSAYWTYTATPPRSLYSPRISGAQRLPNGNTLICEGDSGILFEIDPAKNTVWKYVNPVIQTGIVSQGNTPDISNLVFRCKFFEPSYPGFAGHTLTPGLPIELNPLPYICTMHFTGIAESPSMPRTSIRAINPFTNELSIETNSNLLNTKIVLLDVTGRPVDVFNNTSLGANSRTQLKLENNLSSGIYFLNINCGDQNFTLKLIHL